MPDKKVGKTLKKSAPNQVPNLVALNKSGIQYHAHISLARDVPY